MNNQLLNLATAIQNKIHQLHVDNFSEIDKDILLEDLRTLYKLAQQIEVVQKKQAVNAGFNDKAAIENEESLTHIANTHIESKKQEVEKTKVSFNVEAKEDTSPSSELNEVPLEDLIASIRQELNAEKQQSNVEKEKNLTYGVELNLPNTQLIENNQQAIHSKDQNIGIGGNVAPSLNEVFTREEPTLNERSSSSPVKELHNLIASKTSVSTLLDFNSRILLTKELFNGNSEYCNNFIAQLERCKTLDEAKTLVNTNALSKGWKAENEAVKLLVNLVRKVFA